ncbi:hypothetical protein C5748_08425 [Phyllobacterium phragmitis]|uniref:Uncharacterized protein n=1 Tax=Phyllobacterium phragmitis TaxID=2670329 RepID=A0A2S9ITN4_9HYPH|nr:hypothetical protein C5748_08425 [Phyllobacterium phragmitis]
MIAVGFAVPEWIIGSSPMMTKMGALRMTGGDGLRLRSAPALMIGRSVKSVIIGLDPMIHSGKLNHSNRGYSKANPRIHG